MEPRFGHDFSGVRVHTDRKAAESARAVNAEAYTVGRDVVFGAGRYAPGTGEGHRLIAHELAHVLQRGTGTIRRQQPRRLAPRSLAEARRALDDFIATADWPAVGQVLQEHGMYDLLVLLGDLSAADLERVRTAVVPMRVSGDHVNGPRVGYAVRTAQSLALPPIDDLFAALMNGDAVQREYADAERYLQERIGDMTSAAEPLNDHRSSSVRAANQSVISRIVQECARQGITDRSHIAYVLATAHHESRLGQWMTERGHPNYEGRADLGNTQPGDGARFIGRGFVQITGRANYQYYAIALARPDIMQNPQIIARDQALAATILVHGMRLGIFRPPHRLSTYGSDGSFRFVGARAIINPDNNGPAIAAIARNYRNNMRTRDATPRPNAPSQAPSVRANTTSI
jgi:hypothetical protein